jgi:hypothetical protein
MSIRSSSPAQSRMSSLAQRHPLACFFVLTYVAAWCLWAPLVIFRGTLPPAVAFILVLLGGWVPSTVAIVLVAIIYGRRGVGRLFGRLVKWRVGLRWDAVVLILPLLKTAATTARQGLDRRRAATPVARDCADRKAQHLTRRGNSHAVDTRAADHGDPVGRACIPCCCHHRSQAPQVSRRQRQIRATHAGFSAGPQTVFVSRRSSGDERRPNADPLAMILVEMNSAVSTLAASGSACEMT